MSLVLNATSLGNLGIHTKNVNENKKYNINTTHIVPIVCSSCWEYLLHPKLMDHSTSSQPKICIFNHSVYSDIFSVESLLNCFWYIRHT